MGYRVEVTDTFGGEANYSWVHRHELPYFPAQPDGFVKRSQLVRAAKKAEGWTGVRCDTVDMGDTIEVRPRGACMVMFIHWHDE